MPYLKTQWRQICAELKIEFKEAEFADLLKRWNEPQRHYHTPQHLTECLQKLDDVTHLLSSKHDCALLALALFFHDVIYEIPGSNNEQASAELAIAFLIEKDLARKESDLVSELILATRHGAPLDESPCLLTQIILDIDLAILASEPKRFEEYELQIRHEYRIYPEQEYLLGRKRVLEKFLKADRIYLSDFFHDKYERQARENLNKALQ